MKLTFDKTLSLVAVGVMSVLHTAQAASVYEIVNLEDFDLKGTLAGTRTGYATAVNDQEQLVGVSKGKKKLNSADVEGGVIDVEDGIAPEEKIVYSINLPLVANNFTFTAEENSSPAPWTPTFDSINGTTAPELTDANDASTVNSVDAVYYDINDAGVKVGSMTAQQRTVEYTGTTEGQEFWYLRDYESHGVVKDGDSEIELLPPYTTYVKDAQTVELGGWSTASAINNNGLVTGYASTAISQFGGERVDYCLGTSNTLPVDVCVQQEQYPTLNSRGQTVSSNIQYQIRGYVWQVEAGTASGTELPLGLTPAADSSLIYTAQGLGVNSAGVVAGRSHVYRNDDTNKLRMDAAYWAKDANGEYQYHWVPMADEVSNSIAYDINDSGILVGSYKKYIDGYLRDKFFYFDTTTPDTEIVTPNDFFSILSDRSSRAKDINNKGQVVGFIETTGDKDKPRPKAGFLYDKTSDEFNNINDLLTCESKGYVKGADNSWSRNKVEVQDGTGKTLSYNSDILVVEGSSINENGTIVGTAFIRKPQYQFDADGNLIIGDNGLPLFELNGNGEPVTAYLPRMVVLQPAASASACDLADDSNDGGNFERSGAAGIAWLLLLPFVWLRRKMFS
ncbi:DUF3466 family protein [Shewanella sp. AS16]|uniref:DUF3466 family protein n=1 Tax=Shewanella sp. AS16 TaxID=2907625 RepID=UPI001F2D7CAC|nr:DUF3466 family protein [Shewanella sp. AS16]MCE9684724.1 DUF3466 family protein [Shewanella sp. AS16]